MKKIEKKKSRIKQKKSGVKTHDFFPKIHKVTLATYKKRKKMKCSTNFFKMLVLKCSKCCLEKMFLTF